MFDILKISEELEFSVEDTIALVSHQNHQL